MNTTRVLTALVILGSSPGSSQDLAVSVFPSGNVEKDYSALHKVSELTVARKVDLPAGMDPVQAFQNACGPPRNSLDYAAQRLFFELNDLNANVLPNAPREVILPPCGFVKPGRTVEVLPGETVGSVVYREMGTIGPKTQAAIEKSNEGFDWEQQIVGTGFRLKLPYTLATRAFELKDEVKLKKFAVTADLRTVRGVVNPRVVPSAELNMSSAKTPAESADCSTTDLSRWPFDQSEVERILGTNERSRRFLTRPATILIADTGVLDGDLPSYFRPSKEVGGVPQVDDDHNGCYDDIFGTGLASELGFPRDLQNPESELYGHGSLIADLAAGGALTPALESLVRSRLGLRLYSLLENLGSPVQPMIRPSWNRFSSALGYVYDEERVRVINVSQVADSDLSLSNVLDEHQTELIVVAAAGNIPRNLDVELRYPAAYSWDYSRGVPRANVISVTAANRGGGILEGVGRGRNTVDIAAPGCGFFARLPSGEKREIDGTSAATAIVSFAAGLLIAEGLPVMEVKQRLMDSSDRAPQLTGMVRSEALLNLPKALSLFEDVVEDSNGAVYFGKIVELKARGCQDLDGRLLLGRKSSSGVDLEVRTTLGGRSRLTCPGLSVKLLTPAGPTVEIPDGKLEHLITRRFSANA